MYKLVLSEAAEIDLDGIVTHMIQKLSAPKTTTDFLNELDKCYEYLKSDPLIYEYCRDTYLSKKGYRKVVIKNYLLIYRIDNSIKTIFISRFFHGAENYEKLI